MKPKDRESNFELLRILCMMGVLVDHVIVTLYQEQIHTTDWSAENQGRVFLVNACAIVLNCFVMISGYFTIRFSWDRVARYCLLCGWYAVLCWLCCGGNVWQMLFPVGESSLWFVPAYLGLMLMAPMLNAGLRAVSSKERGGVPIVVLLLLCDVYLGYWHQRAEVGQDGYNLLHLMTMYCLGNWIAQRDWQLRHAGWWWLACIALMTVLHAVKIVWFPMSFLYSLHLNSPMMIVGSTLLFLWTKGWKVQSRMVNRVAASVFAVYLVHCNPAVSPYFYHSCSRVLDWSDCTAFAVLLLAAYVMLFFLVCVLADMVRIRVMRRVKETIGDKVLKI